VMSNVWRIDGRPPLVNIISAAIARQWYYARKDEPLVKREIQSAVAVFHSLFTALRG
jgi:hypothetical protein